MRVHNGDHQWKNVVDEMANLVRPVARPKAIFKASYIDDKDGDTVTVDGVKFTSRVLRINLEPVERVFPYIATCGTELEKISVATDDFMRAFCLDVIKMMVVGSAVRYLTDHIRKYYALSKISHMNPGSIDSWQITEQPALFSLFGNVEKIIGVKLAPSCMMFPINSVSGLYFSTEVTFENCQLCPRDNCVSRRALYDRVLVKKYQKK
ncbi:vitamin B12 dependent-methionine synthase activation domain-containing protein [Chloroflexota bacterium]